MAKDVLVRAFGSEPVRCFAATIQVGGKAVNCYRLKPDVQIGLSRKDLFRWSEETFDALASAYAEGDADRLDQLWSQAEPFDPSGLPVKV